MRSPLPSSALFVCVVVSLGACSWITGPPVAVVGDSITVLDESGLREQLGGSYDVGITGEYGATVAEVLTGVGTAAERSPEQVIINLGTNDVLKDLPVEDSMAALREMVGRFDDARCVHLVNINEHMLVPLTEEPVTMSAQRFNGAVADLAASDERVSVIDWNAVAASTLGGGDPPTSTLTDDSIHPNADGNRRLHELYSASLDACG